MKTPAAISEPENRFWHHAEFILPLMLLALHGIFYNTIGNLASLRGVDFGPWLITPLDRVIPFSALFIIPYTAIWLLPIYMIIRLKRQDGFTVLQMRRVSGAFVALILVCYALWILLPVQMTLRAADGLLLDGGALGQFTHFTYQNATSWNACPSFHVAAPWLICRILTYYTGKVPSAIAWLTAAIFVATVGIRVHYLLDIAGGMLVAEAVYRVVLLRLEQKESLALIPSRVMVAAYGSLCVGALAIFAAIQAVL